MRSTSSTPTQSVHALLVLVLVQIQEAKLTYILVALVRSFVQRVPHAMLESVGRRSWWKARKRSHAHAVMHHGGHFSHSRAAGPHGGIPLTAVHHPVPVAVELIKGAVAPIRICVDQRFRTLRQWSDRAELRLPRFEHTSDDEDNVGIHRERYLR